MPPSAKSYEIAPSVACDALSFLQVHRARFDWPRAQRQLRPPLPDAAEHALQPARSREFRLAYFLVPTTHRGGERRREIATASPRLGQGQSGWKNRQQGPAPIRMPIASSAPLSPRPLAPRSDRTTLAPGLMPIAGLLRQVLGPQVKQGREDRQAHWSSRPYLQHRASDRPHRSPRSLLVAADPAHSRSVAIVLPSRSGPARRAPQQLETSALGSLGPRWWLAPPPRRPAQAYSQPPTAGRARTKADLTARLKPQ